MRHEIGRIKIPDLTSDLCRIAARVKVRNSLDTRSSFQNRIDEIVFADTYRRYDTDPSHYDALLEVHVKTR